MAQDIRELFKNEKLSGEKMPVHHKQRFLNKLDEALPVQENQRFSWYYIAASVVVLLGLTFGAYSFFGSGTNHPIEIANTNESDNTKTLGDVSPGLKKIEDYYLASINFELTKIKPTPETKELFDGYVARLNELNTEYKRLSLELTESGPSELTINALIDNLKLRLNLLNRLKEQLKELSINASESGLKSQSV